MFVGFFSLSPPHFCSHLTRQHHIIQITVAMREFYTHNLMQPSMVCGHFAICYIRHVEYVLPPLGPHNATGPPTAPTEIAQSNPSNVHLKTNVLSPPQSSPPISPPGSEIPTRTAFSDIGNDCPYFNNHSPPLTNSSLAVSRNGRIHISITLDHVMLFSCAGLAAVSFLVAFFNFPRLCEKF